MGWLASLASIAAAAEAHHSYTEFERTQTVEIEGTLVKLAWQNPHTVLEVRVVDTSGSATVWDIETGAVNALRRQGAPLDAFKVGDVVKVAGWPSKRSAARMYATNVLDNGRELMFQTRVPRWPGATNYAESFVASTSTLAVAGNQPTLFRVWTTNLEDPDTRGGFTRRAQFSLTEAAKRAVAAFDPVTQSTSSGCTPKGMPIVMGQPFPMEMIDRGDTLLVRLEEYDTVRTIYMSGAEQRASREKSLLGRSVGRWEGATLVVDTDRLDSPYFNASGVPLSQSARMVERFAVSDDGRRLVYELIVTEPETFTEPAHAMRAWAARDGEELLPYDCKAPRY
jgi:hypothetical protein